MTHPIQSGLHKAKPRNYWKSIKRDPDANGSGGKPGLSALATCLRYQMLQFSLADPMDNLKAKVSTRIRNYRVADLAKDEIATALNSKDIPSPRQFIQFFIATNPDTTR